MEFILIWIVNFKFEKKSIDLGFRKGISAFHFDRILGGKHHEGRFQNILGAEYRHFSFLHGLQKRRLSLGTGPVNLIGQDKLAENRPFVEFKKAISPAILFDDVGSEYIGRHQIRRKLDAGIPEI